MSKRSVALRLTTVLLAAATACTPKGGGGGGGGGGVTAVDACGARTSGPTTVTGTISGNTSWDAAHSPYVIAGNATVKVGSGATLTLGACTRVVLGGGAGIDVKGHLVAQGQSGREVSFEASGKAYWGHVVAETAGATLSLAYTKLTHGGDASRGDTGVIEVVGDRSATPKTTLKVDHVTVTDAAGSGVDLDDGAAFTSTSTALTVTGTGAAPAMDGSTPIPAYPVKIFTESAGSIPDGTYTGNHLDAVLLVGLDTVSRSETLADHGVPYVLGDGYDPGTFDIMPASGATSPTTVTVPAGVKLELSAGAQITAAASGSGVPAHLVLAGNQASHVTVTGSATDRWNDLVATAPATLKLTYVDLDHGGLTPSNGGDGASVFGDGGSAANPVAPVLEVHHVRITDSGTVGVLLQGGASFAAGSSDLTIAGAGADVSPDTGNPVAVPLAIDAEALYTLPTGGTLAGKQPGVWVNGGQVGVDTTLPDFGVPYLVDGDLTVGGTSTPATLTVSPGVTLEFAAGDRLDVQIHGLGEGALMAEGTAAKPITFTSWSASPKAGGWVGIVFDGDGSPAPATSQLTHVTVAYGGADNGYANYACEPNGGTENGAVGFFDWMPPSGTIAASTLVHTTGNGIVEGWTGVPVDLKTGNTFTDVAGCSETDPMPATGCPPSPACQ